MSSFRRSKRPSRASRGHDKGSAWISYSDMMAALILVFVLVLSYSIYQYFAMLEIKTMELDEQKTQLGIQQIQLDDQEKSLLASQAALLTKEEELQLAQAALTLKEEDLVLIQGQLALQKSKMDETEALLTSQQLRIDQLIGVRTTIIQELSETLSASNLSATVDSQTGDIVLDSAVFFDTASATIKEGGRDFLNTFIPLYLDVLLRPEYEDYLAEIIIEGHTDSKGSYQTNLKLSQERARSVAEYCLQMPQLTLAQREQFQNIQTATGKSFSNRKFFADGTEDMDSSRRVEFKFRLKDAEMVEEMSRILSGSQQQPEPSPTAPPPPETVPEQNPAGGIPIPDGEGGQMQGDSGNNNE